jgi:NAD(P)H dehydrogenase (quinone)
MELSAMPKVLVLYYSAYGHIEAMAMAIAEGVRSAGAAVDIKRVPETAPEEVARAGHFKLDQAAPVAHIDDLIEYDAIIVGTGTRFGRISSQMASFLDQAGDLFMRGALNGKVGGAFTSSATQHGGQETTLFSLITKPALQLPGPNETRRDHRRKPLRSLHHRRRRWFTPAERE